METMTDAITGWAQQAKENAGWIVALGVLAVIAGLIALAAPWATGAGLVVIIGIALVVGGVARIIAAFSAGSFGQGSLAFIGGVLTLVAGVLLVTRPGLGLATLTLLLGTYLLVDGIFGGVLAFRVRPDHGWGWMLFSAVLGVVLGIMLLAEWPLSGVWAIGTLVGVNMLFAGFSMISMGSVVRRAIKRAD